MPYVLVLQSDLLSTLETTIVARIMREAPINMVARLNPAIIPDGDTYRVRMQEMAALQRNRLGPAVGNLSNRHSEFVAAIDLLFTGI